jgi:pyridoxal phosphate enzyme (YggS family)
MSALIETLQANLARVNARIAAAAHAVSRDPAAITLLAVSKTFDADTVLAAAASGQRDFGENYVQEAVEKIARVTVLAPDLPLTWHFIGPIQSNKTRAIAEHMHWVHSIDRQKIAERLSEQRPAGPLPPLNVLIQVNVSGEASKSGVAPADVAALAPAIDRLPGLRLRGLMTIPEPTDDIVLLRARFARLRRLFDDLRTLGVGRPWDTLSMGMSADLEAAIAEGATLVRVGTAIFGSRTRPQPAAA